ncbi:hypothetical protein MAR_008233 [Mya arenaria]|uniref:NACHT domain-containing protein n=1 Tax=Mya arenaria TaxID=6604 RepID=A0ABY7DYE0_MYAAR|nr:hypothetical protein MAR_008233 [Mya arenaria]
MYTNHSAVSVNHSCPEADELAHNEHVINCSLKPFGMPFSECPFVFSCRASLNAFGFSLLLDKISESKLAYSLKALFDAMKLKYKKLHDHCIEVRKQTQKISSTEFLPPPWKDGKGNRIVLEGKSGSGKSLLCSRLAYIWATTPNYFRNTYQHVLLLNMAELEGNFETAVYRSLFPDNFKISVNEFWNMLERNAQNVLLVIDDYDRECE